MPTLTRGYFYQRLHETGSYSLKEHEDVSLKRQNLVFPVVPECIWFVFCLWLNIFTSEVSDLPLHLEIKGQGGRESWYTYPKNYIINAAFTLPTMHYIINAFIISSTLYHIINAALLMKMLEFILMKKMTLRRVLLTLEWLDNWFYQEILVYTGELYCQLTILTHVELKDMKIFIME